jgi:hypothetical protein
MKLLLGEALWTLCFGLTVTNGCSGTKTTCSIVLASDYDQSCTVDEDCITVGEVPSCSSIPCCLVATINAKAMTPYMTALSRAYASASRLPFGCACGNGGVGPCCRGGKCATDPMCVSTADTLAACADAGGSCARVDPSSPCSRKGPADSCAYSDEVCCLNALSGIFESDASSGADGSGGMAVDGSSDGPATE